jgi:hypothetical protein
MTKRADMLAPGMDYSAQHNLKSWSYAGYTYDGDTYCTNHLPAGVDKDGDDVSPIFADSEWDYYPCCAECGAVFDYVNLTDEGRKAEGEEE